MYKPGGTIAQVLQRIQTHEYVLPAIQREFVWKEEQIERLFDSLMQGYPFGTFLFWKVSPANSGKFKFYDFVLDYHERDSKYCPELPKLHHQNVSAVLDGQQRMTALNIGLRGSMTMKRRNKWKTSADAYGKRRLYMNVLRVREADEDGSLYEFRFLEDNQAKAKDGALWFPVHSILGMRSWELVNEWLIEQGLPKAESRNASHAVFKLQQVVHSEPLIHLFEVEDDSGTQGHADRSDKGLERVLNIFIRLNSGGTALSYSDLLLSVAVAQWKDVDARSAIRGLVSELNRIGGGFDLSQDFVLKAGLMLADVASVGFKVENFTHDNMIVLESKWPEIRTALVRTVELAASFGLTGQTLRADSALLPIAYSLYQRKVPENYVTHASHGGDRSRIQKWLVRSLVKPSGIWGSGLDTLLTALREVLKADGGERFPVEAIEHVMEVRGKSLIFHPAEIDELLSLTYGDSRTFPLLSLMFSFIDLRNQHHVDHVFPSARFTVAKLRGAGVPAENIERFRECAQQLPNLQLLGSSLNIEKQAALPLAWLERTDADGCPVWDKPAQQQYCVQHMLGDVPAGITDFESFWTARREKMKDRLEALLQPDTRDSAMNTLSRS